MVPSQSAAARKPTSEGEMFPLTGRNKNYLVAWLCIKHWLRILVTNNGLRASENPIIMLIAGVIVTEVYNLNIIDVHAQKRTLTIEKNNHSLLFKEEIQIPSFSL